MILSMTGYGKSEKTINSRIITVEVKSVNSRYFEYSSRVPRGFAFVDDKLKKLLSQQITRGKVELFLTVQSIGESDTIISVDIDMAKSYYTAFESIANELGVKNDVTAQTFARFNDVFVMTKAKQDEEQLWQDIKLTASKAIESFIDMRKLEGEKMSEDVISRLDFIAKSVEVIEKTSADRLQKYREKLYMRLKEVLENTNIDEARILTEAAIFADKTAVDEETVRLYSHLKQFADILSAGGVSGRKLDFLTQEINREINTIGSKCNDLSVTQIVVDMKSELEKIREQIQNIE